MEKRESKTITLIFAKQNINTWKYIKEGKKDIETRAATIKYRDIQAKDVVIFLCNGKKFEKTIKRVVYLKSIEALARKFDLKRINPDLVGLEQNKKAYYGYPGYKEKIEEFGLVALELE